MGRPADREDRVLFCLQCVDGYPYLNRCPASLYFDDINKLCTFKNEARCGPLPTSECILPAVPAVAFDPSASNASHIHDSPRPHHRDARGPGPEV